MKKLALSTVLAAAVVAPTANAKSDLTVDFRLDRGIRMISNTYTHIGMDIDFGSRYIHVNGSIFNLQGSPSLQFTGSCEDRNPAANALLCTLTIGTYTGIMSVSLDTLRGNLSTIGATTADNDTSTITLIYAE